MEIQNLTNETIRRCIPNVLTEAEGETPLVDKLLPFISTAKAWLETEYIGQEDFLSANDENFAQKIIVKKAVADALPSLDLVATPTGMAVVNTDTMAPASKDRVERLICSLREQIQEDIPKLIEICNHYAKWRTSKLGRYFRSSFIRPSDVRNGIHGLEALSYADVRLKAVAAEAKLAERYLGRNFMNALRDDYNDGVVTREHPLVSLIISAIVSLLDHDVPFDHNRLWRTARLIINELKFHPDYKRLWESEMGNQFNNQGFVNDIKGGFYF